MSGRASESRRERERERERERWGEREEERERERESFILLSPCCTDAVRPKRVPLCLG